LYSIKFVFLGHAVYGLDEIKEDALASAAFFVNEDKIKFYTVPDANLPIDSSRNQVNAEIIFDYIDRFSTISQEPNEIVIYIVDQDMYIRGMNFIFGVANTKKKRIVLSLYRLKRGYYGENMVDVQKYRERVFKEIMHELGHVYGLGHCKDKNCVMSFSKSILEVDHKLPMFCRDCLDKLSGQIEI